MTFIKVCGVTRRQDVDAAAGLGVDALGFILVEGSPRRVSLEEAVSLAESVPAGIHRVAVMMNPSPGELAEAAACGLPVLTRAGSGADETAAPWALAAAVAGNEPDTWAGSLMALLEGMDNAERRAERAHAARAHAEKNHSITETAKRYRELLERASGF